MTSAPPWDPLRPILDKGEVRALGDSATVVSQYIAAESASAGSGAVATVPAENASLR